MILTKCLGSEFEFLASTSIGSSFRLDGTRGGCFSGYV